MSPLSHFTADWIFWKHEEARRHRTGGAIDEYVERVLIAVLFERSSRYFFGAH